MIQFRQPHLTAMLQLMNWNQHYFMPLLLQSFFVVRLDLQNSDKFH